MRNPLALSLLAVSLVFLKLPDVGFAKSSMLRCPAAEDWRGIVETTVRDAEDVELLSLALTSSPGCSQVAKRSTFLCSWRLEERILANSVYAGDAWAAVVCIVNSEGMIARSSRPRERDAAPTCSIRFGFRPDPAGPCAPESS